MTADLERAWRDLCTRWDRAGYSSLSVDERAWLNLRSLIDAVENGGIISFFYNSGADHLPECRMALQGLNALKVLALVDRVAGLFGLDVPGTVEERNEIIDSWPDDDARDVLLMSIDDELMPLLRVLDDELESFVVQRGLARPG